MKAIKASKAAAKELVMSGTISKRNNLICKVKPRLSGRQMVSEERERPSDP